MPVQITVLGSGAMATACSILLTEQPDQSVCLWARNPDHARSMTETRENSRLLPGVTLPERVYITSDIGQAMRDCDLTVVAIPTKFLREALVRLRPGLKPDVPIVSVVKGIENETFLRPSEIINDVVKNAAVVALGGPAHAEEIARRLPASVVAACRDESLAEHVQRVFTTDRFRVYTNTDLVGVELACALKNVVAIAAGICDGLQYGDNAKAALVTRGLVEITRFGVSFGAKADTFTGLAGIGDLITTCTSRHSRNRFVGEQLGKGRTLRQILDSMDAVAEGITTTQSVFEIASQRNIEMPITQQIYQVLFEKISPETATTALMLRPPRGE